MSSAMSILLYFSCLQIKMVIESSKAHIYLEVYENNDEEIICPVYTGIVLFVTSYCDVKDLLKYTLVKCHEYGPVPQGSMRLCSQVMHGLCWSAMKLSDVDDDVLGCSLPVAVTLDGKMLTSGLCSVLRLMLKRCSQVNTQLTPLLVSGIDFCIMSFMNMYEFF